MTEKEIKAALDALVEEFGEPGSDVLLSISSDQVEFIYASFYPRGMCRNEYISVRGTTFKATLSLLRSKIEGGAVQREAETVQKLAIALIKITGVKGICTDADLRDRGDFTTGQIVKLGARAEVEAEKIAANGPFKITVQRGANAI